uniref:Uncharacterized protein n=1 Tax=Anguilla anguilla TaxID=7936 RepID=A0A0E9TIB4_ANGAN
MYTGGHKMCVTNELQICRSPRWNYLSKGFLRQTVSVLPVS